MKSNLSRLLLQSGFRVIGFSFLFALPFLIGSSGVNNSALKDMVGGTGNCNIPEGYNFSYTDCEGGGACTNLQWRNNVPVPPFGHLIYLYEMKDYCEEQNPACDPHQSFTKTRSSSESTCLSQGSGGD